MQWIQDPSRSNVDNLINVRRNASRHFRKNKKAYLKAKIEELETNSKVNHVRDLYRGINDFKKGYQPRSIKVNDEKGELVADTPHYYGDVEELFLPAIECYEDNDAWQAEIHILDPLVPKPSAFEFELAIGKLRNHKPPGIYQTPVEFMKADGRTFCCAIHKHFISIGNKEDLPEEWKESIVVTIYKNGDKTDCNNYRCISLLPTTYKILSNILLSMLIPYAEEVIVDHQC